MLYRTVLIALLGLLAASLSACGDTAGTEEGPA